MYKALDTKVVYENFGRFTRTHLDTIWDEDEDAPMRDELLQLMMRFKLCYEIPGCPQHYIAPQLLSPEQPSYVLGEKSNLTLRYRYEFMPKGILTRLIVELHEYIEDQILVWKTGVVLTNGTAHAEVIENYPKSEILIRVSGSDQKRWLSAITHELEKIHRSYNTSDRPSDRRLKYQTLIPCNCSICKERAGKRTDSKDTEKPHNYSYERLQQFLRDGQYKIQCQESYSMVDVRQLIDDILYQSLDVSQKELSKAISPKNISQGLPIQDVSSILGNAQKQIYQPMKEVFISYAWGGNSEDITNEVDGALKAAKIDLVRDKRDLGFKGRIKSFMQQIGQGKAVVVIISDKYLKSENCMFELIQIFQNDEFTDRIFPVVLEDAKIHKPRERLKYVQYWEAEIEAFENDLKTVSAANMEGFREDIDLYHSIRRFLPRLTNILKDMNTLTPKIHTDSGFAELISAIKKRLES